MALTRRARARGTAGWQLGGALLVFAGCANTPALQRDNAEQRHRAELLAEQVATLRAEVAMAAAESEAMVAEVARLQSELEAASPAAPAPPEDGAHASGPNGPTPGPTGFSGAYQAISCDAAQCIMHRALLDRMLDDPERLARQARLVVATRDGAAVGVKVYALQRGGVLRLLGFQNGDMLVSVNDRPVRASADLAPLSGLLRNATALELAIVRRGEPRTVTIAIQ